MISISIIHPFRFTLEDNVWLVQQIRISDDGGFSMFFPDNDSWIELHRNDDLCVANIA
jgi:hypothetical protein